MFLKKELIKLHPAMCGERRITLFTSACFIKKLCDVNWRLKSYVSRPAYNKI
jgi:hypothetical protein